MEKHANSIEESSLCEVSPEPVSRSPLAAIDALYRNPLPASRTGPLYNAFSYPTKISPEVIAIFIATHTRPGETVLDTFSGSGTTGMAAKLCDQPTAQMLKIAETLGLEPQWGPRDAHLVDVSTLGCFISQVLSEPPKPSEFLEAVERLLSTARAELAGIYSVDDPNGKPGEIRHVIWSDVVACPKCGTHHKLWDVAVGRKPARFLATFDCPKCKQSINLKSCERVLVEQVDVFGDPKFVRLRVPVEVHGKTNGKNWRRPAAPGDTGIEVLERLALPASAPRRKLSWGELYRSGYHAGIEELHDFYTPRNFMAMARCMEIASREPEPLASALKFLILSYNASHSTLMTRIVAKKSQEDFVLTGAQSGVLYVSGLPVEKNVIEGIRRKAKTIAEAFDLLFRSKSKVFVHKQSSEALPLADESIDYVFTDPPFGDYIPYGEVNQVNELWLEDTTCRDDELVVSKSGQKDVEHYRSSMTAVFREIDRVLKGDGLATVVFHSAHSKIWKALCTAYADAGLRVRRTSILDKIQASFKQVVSTVSVKGDPLILLGKGGGEEVRPAKTDIFAQVTQGRGGAEMIDERAMFSEYVAKSIAAGQQVTLGMAEFSDRLRAQSQRVPL